MTVDEATIQKAVESVSDNYEISGEVYQTPRHLVHQVVVDGQRAVCKHVREEIDPQPLALEAALVEEVNNQCSLNVPSVLGRGSRFAIFSRIDATEYTNDLPQERREVRLRAFGEALASLHDETTGQFEEFGYLTLVNESGDISAGGSTSWGECWETLVDDWLARLSDTKDEDVGRMVRDTTRRAHQAGYFEGVEPVLTHADAGPANIRFSETDEVWFLDWEGAMAFPGEYDLARARTDFFDLPHAVESQKLETNFLAGYQSVRSLSTAFEFRQRLYRATLAAKFLPGGVRAAEQGVIEHDPKRFRQSIREYIKHQLRATERSLN